MESLEKKDPETPSKPKELKKKPMFDYCHRNLDICAVCKNKYNVGDRIPRILVNWGHTFCTSCLLKYHHGKDHIRCPSCKKLVKHLDNVETLPLNLSIFGEIVKNDPVIMMFIDPSSEASFASSCPNHIEKQRHYYCSFHENNFCRECMKAFHKGDKWCVVDLCDIQKLFQLNEQNLMKNELIVKTRNKAKGKMRKEEFFIANQ